MECEKWSCKMMERREAPSQPREPAEGRTSSTQASNWPGVTCAHLASRLLSFVSCIFFPSFFLLLAALHFFDFF
jgi:hypothetical protein